MNFTKRVFYMRDERQREGLIALVKNLPLADKKPLQVTVEEFRPVRKPDQNALLWSGPLRDISEQAWLEGRQYSAEVWHEWLKRELLPDENDSDFDERWVKDGYKKWEYGPDGERYLVGSTTKLTVRGMARHTEQVQAFGASLGVRFSVSPNDRGI